MLHLEVGQPATGAPAVARAAVAAHLADAAPLGYTNASGLLALRGADDTHSGLLSLGFVHTAAAARPRLVLDLHGDAGVDLDVHAPLVGGGLRTAIAIVGPLGVALDAGLYIVIDGIVHTRAVIDLSAMLALGFVGVGLLRWPLVAVVATLAPVAIALSWFTE